ncbi:Aste57867_10978 [Aphanomyces stellatus]|uniref:Aste57867_10978 protein n=1 Tax=Aphanomyces stellatus TaxID=120398 RepID=A0A485KRV5_9STRA|nr:hypothetical protein As57867_010937 [Aphanomyces stellatus]VFT87846.1 Aste57867_10978 [Aphanomyces stellatus]
MKPTKPPNLLVLTVHGATLARASKHVQVQVSCGAKTFLGPKNRTTTKFPTWHQPTFTADVRDKTHATLHLALVTTKLFVKRKLGQVAIHVSASHLATTGSYTTSIEMNGVGYVHVTVELRHDDTATGLAWARNQVAHHKPTEMDDPIEEMPTMETTCTTLLQCVPLHASRDAIVKRACGPCFLALLAKQKAGEKEAVAVMQRDSPRRRSSHHLSFLEISRLAKPSLSRTSTASTTVSDDGHIEEDEACKCPSIEEWMQARKKSAAMHSHAMTPTIPAFLESVETTTPSVVVKPPAPLALPHLFDLAWCLPLLALILHACITHILSLS